MIRKGCRECFVLTDQNELERLREKMELAVSEIDVPSECKVDVYGDPFKKITLEVSCSHEEDLKAIDLKAFSKFMEVCESENLNTHFCEPLEAISTETGEHSERRENSGKRGRPIEVKLSELSTEYTELKNHISRLESKNSDLNRKVKRVEDGVTNILERVGEGKRG